jgi:Putative zinc-finger
VTDASHPRDALLDLVYGELSADEAQAVQRHVDGCAACAETVAGYRAVRSAARALPREARGTAGLESLLHHGALAAARARRRRVVRWAGPLAAAAAAAFVAVVALRPPAPAPGSLGPLADNRPTDQAKAKAPEPTGEAKETASGGLVGGSKPRPSSPAAPAPVAAPQRQVASARPAKDGVRDEGLGRSDEARAVVAEEERPPAVSSELRAPAAKLAAAPVALGGAAGGPAAAGPTLADKATPPALADRSAPPASAEQKAEAAATAASPAPMRKSAAAVSEMDAVANVPAMAKLSASPGDAGDGQRSADEARRAWLIARLNETKGGAALPLLAELCGVEVRLGRREDAVRVCGQVVRDFPDTPEASAARQQLDRLELP